LIVPEFIQSCFKRVSSVLFQVFTTLLSMSIFISRLQQQDHTQKQK